MTTQAALLKSDRRSHRYFVTLVLLVACAGLTQSAHSQNEDGPSGSAVGAADLTPLERAEQLAQSDAAQAIEISQRVLQEATAAGNVPERAAALRILAIARYFQADFPRALERALDAERLYSDLGDLDEQASLLSLMGAIHGSSKQLDRALDVYGRALEVSRAAGGGRGEAIVLMNIGKTHFDLNNYEESVSWYEQSIARFNDLLEEGVPVRPDAMLFARMGIADAFMRLGKIDDAIVRARAVLEASETNSLVYQNALAILGEAHLERGDLDQAEIHLEKARQEADRTQRPSKRAETFSLLARLAEARGRFQEALGLQRLANELNLEIFNEQNSSELARLESQYESSLREQQLQLQALELQRNRSTLIAVSALAVAALLLALILFQLYRVKQKSNQSLRVLAETDPLTGLINRRTMYDCISRLKSGASDSSNATICLLDLDNFKQVNDQHGHTVGDELLVNIAATLQNHVRSDDRVARWGGEEFLVLLVGRTRDKAEEIARRLCEKISAVSVSLDGDVSVSVTASVGVAQFDHGAGDREVIRRADSAMYQAKLAGKNQVAAF